MLTDEEKAQCECRGQRRWHMRYGQAACDLVRLYESRRERTRVRNWTAGTPISIPDTDYIL